MQSTSNLLWDRRFLLAAGAAMLLSACGKQDVPASPAKAPMPVSIEAIEGQARGFPVGQAMRAQAIYVFFDPQCPHCAALWNETKPLLTRARFVWVPVALMGPKSLGQGGAILAAPNPAAAMEENEASVLAQQGGISAPGISAEGKEPIQKNTELFDRMGLSSVPTIVARNAKTGELVTISGSLPASQLAERIGL
jgi:thiol:disulfide interchange protein DsbG